MGEAQGGGEVTQRMVGGGRGVGTNWRKLCHCSILRGVRFLGGSISGLEYFFIAAGHVT